MIGKLPTLSPSDISGENSLGSLLDLGKVADGTNSNNTQEGKSTSEMFLEALNQILDPSQKANELTSSMIASEQNGSKSESSEEMDPLKLSMMVAGLGQFAGANANPQVPVVNSFGTQNSGIELNDGKTALGARFGLDSPISGKGLTKDKNDSLVQKMAEVKNTEVAGLGQKSQEEISQMQLMEKTQSPPNTVEQVPSTKDLPYIDTTRVTYMPNIDPEDLEYLDIIPADGPNKNSQSFSSLASEKGSILEAGKILSSEMSKLTNPMLAQQDKKSFSLIGLKDVTDGSSNQKSKNAERDFSQIPTFGGEQFFVPQANVTKAEIVLPPTEIKRIVDTSSILVKSGGEGKIVLKLRPQELGGIEIRAFDDKGKISIEMIAEKPETQKQLQSALNDIIQSVKTETSFDVSMVVNQQSQNPMMDFGKGHGQNHSSQHQETAQESNVIDFSPLNKKAESASQNLRNLRRSSPGQIDLVI